MLIFKLLSTTGKDTGVGQFPFCIIRQPFSGSSACFTVKLAEGVYAQAPRLYTNDNSTFQYSGLVAAYSSADGIRPEQTLMKYQTTSSNQIGPYGKLGTKEFTIIFTDTNAEYAPSGGNEGAVDFIYAEGFPVDLNSGNSTTARGYRAYAEDGQTPTIANPPNFGTNWLAYFILQDSTHRLIGRQGNRADWANTEFKLIFGRNVGVNSDRGWIQRLDNGTVTWTKRLSQGTNFEPEQGILCYCCGTNGEDTLIKCGNSKGMALIQANGTVAWKKKQDDAADNDTSTHYIDPTGSYAYTVDRTGKLFRITISNGDVHQTTTTFATGTASRTLLALNQATYCAGFDSEGYLWLSNQQYQCLTRMDVSGANPIAVGSYQADSNSGGVSWQAPLVDGDRIVSQLMVRTSSNLNASWFACLATDFSTNTIDQTSGDVYSQKYGIGTNTSNTEYKITNFNTYTTSNTGSWSAVSTTTDSFSITDDTSGYDWDTNAANFDTIVANSTGSSNQIRSQSTVS